jgi:hypothetical protein
VLSSFFLQIFFLWDSLLQLENSIRQLEFFRRTLGNCLVSSFWQSFEVYRLRDLPYLFIHVDGNIRLELTCGL